MTRITKHMRQAIVAKALDKAGVNAALDGIGKRRLQWAEAVRIEAIGGPRAAKKLAAAMDAWANIFDQIPKELRSDGNPVRTDYDIMLNIGGRRFCAQFSDHTDRRPCPREFVLANNHPLAAQFQKIEDDTADVGRKRSEISAQVGATVDKFHTVAKLLEAWPEAAELLPDSTPERTSNLPAVPVGTLNKLVGLPSEKPVGKRRVA